MTLKEKEKIAIDRLRMFEPDEPYYLCYSGGKDSDCIRILAHLAGVKHELHYNLTTVDAPETMRYIQSIPGVHIDKAMDKEGKHITMWNLIVKKKMPPIRIYRYCCEVLKERGGKGHFKITGVRKAESLQRAKNGGLVKIIGKPKTMQKYADSIGLQYEKTEQDGIILNMDNDESRRMAEHCFRTTSTMINPIVDWTDNDVWEFLHHYGCAGNPLYQCGKKRIGCIGCPMQGYAGMKADFKRYPAYKRAYIRAFDRLVSQKDFISDWRSGLDVYKWWTGDDPYQLSFFDDL